MTENFDFAKSSEERIVYVRSVDVTDLPEEMQKQTDGTEQLYGCILRTVRVWRLLQIATLPLCWRARMTMRLTRCTDG